MIRTLRKIRHAIAHWFGWETATMDYWWDTRGPGHRRLVVGFRCTVCGRVMQVLRTPTAKRGGRR